jgi:hypothetical protein
MTVVTSARDALLEPSSGDQNDLLGSPPASRQQLP